MTPYDKIRAALELLEWRVLKAERNNQPIVATRRQLDEALAALAELERSAREPVAYCNGDNLDIGIPLRFQAFTRPQAFAYTPLYAVPPAPVAEIREPTPEECERICTEYERLLMREGTCGGRDAFDAVRAVMWPKSEGS